MNLNATPIAYARIIQELLDNYLEKLEYYRYETTNVSNTYPKRGSKEVESEWLCKVENVMHFGSAQRQTTTTTTCPTSTMASMAKAGHNVGLRLYTSLLLLLSLIALVVGQEQPVHSITSFNNLPARLFFFDDTEVRFSTI